MFDPNIDPKMESFFEALKIPNTYYKDKSYEYQYFFRSLIQKIDSALIFRGLPESWPQDFFLFCLWSLGYVGIFKSERFGDPETKAAFFPVTVSQYDFYYQPVKALVSNPLFQKEFTIHKDCELLKLTPDCFWRGGCLDIIAFYADKLSKVSKSLDMSLINSLTPWAAVAKDQASSNMLKAIYDKAQAGESCIIYRKQEQEMDSEQVIPTDKEPFFTLINDLKSNWIALELLQAYRTILDDFYNEIGLPTSIDKKSHVLNAEADFQSAQSQARIACWVQTLNESFEKINPMFGLNLEVEYAAQTEKKDESLGSGDVSEPND